MATSRSAIAAAIKARLDANFLLSSDPQAAIDATAEDLADIIADAVQAAIASNAAYSSTATFVLADSLTMPVTGTITISTAASCTIP